MVWRVEKFKVVPWPEKLYGQFYDGDSYIVLRTYGNPPKYSYDVHFWLGEHTTIDEAGTAVYKTIELDTYHDGLPVQHREVQGFETAQFVSYFPNGIRILHGGIESGFHHVGPEAYQPRLLQFKGRKDTHVSEVPLARDSLNSGDVFILDDGLTLYQWNGSKCAGVERVKAATLCHAIDDERGGRAQIVMIEEGDNDSAGDKFWTLLGGKGPVKSAAEGGADDDGKAVPKRLCQLSDASGSLQFKEVASGKIARRLLNSNDVLVFDTGEHIFVWIGLGSSKQERAKGLSYATDYLKQHDRPLHLPITKILEGGENEVFNCGFDC